MTSTALDLKEKILYVSQHVKDKEPALVYVAPSLDLLDSLETKRKACSINPKVITAKLKEFGLGGKVKNIQAGPVVTRYEIQLAAGVKLSQVRSVSEDLAVALMTEKVRILAPIPGTSLVGIEIKNEIPEVIGLKAVMSGLGLDRKEELPLIIGVDTTGKPVVWDLAKMPHLLIAGQTGSGKSIGLNAMILSLIYTKTPEELSLVLVDPKRVEMAGYKGVPHVRNLITEPEDAVSMFNRLVSEMEIRYNTLADAGVRNITSFNKVSETKMPYIVVMVDELADLIMSAGKEFETQVVRLAQKARAVGIHLVLATQKPVVKVITGLIKSNMPSRISYQVSSKMDSRVILDQNGAEALIGRGDMLALLPGCGEPERFHGAWVSDSEIQKVTDFLKRGKYGI